MTARRPRILAIDDTPANLLMVGAALGRDVDLQVATSGRKGLAHATACPPDLILLDVMMPGMDGYETFGRLQDDPLTRDIPVIFVTAENSPDDETRGLDHGAADFISKPINPAVLRARVRTHLTIKRQGDLLRSMAFVDGLTGVANRRQFDETLEIEWRSCRRTASPLSLAMIDIDHFKQLNDAYGHQAGDACLKAVASVLKTGMERPRDLIARYGGEEFVCLLPDTELTGARDKTEELRQAVQQLRISHVTSGVAPMVTPMVTMTLTISIGVATVIPQAELTAEGLVAAADSQLFEAKRSGRNRTCSVAFGQAKP